jgi:hypothetical protein
MLKLIRTVLAGALALLSPRTPGRHATRPPVPVPPAPQVRRTRLAPEPVRWADDEPMVRPYVLRHLERLEAERQRLNRALLVTATYGAAVAA